jgi:hypothetical protein
VTFILTLLFERGILALVFLALVCWALFSAFSHGWVTPFKKTLRGSREVEFDHSGHVISGVNPLAKYREPHPGWRYRA